MTKKCVDCGKSFEAFRDNHQQCNDCHQKPKRSNKSSRVTLPPNYLKGGYFNESGYLKEELIVDHARQIAEQLNRERVKMNPTALRRFFTKVRAIERKLDSNNNFDSVIPEIVELVPLVRNATTRNVVPALLKEFIEQNVALAKKDKDAFKKGFVKHFQYVVAFFPRNK